MGEESKKHNSVPQMMSMPGGLRITKDGTWRHDGGEFTHQNVQKYFESRLRYSPEHSQYVVEVDGRCVPVEVEDTAFFVRTIDTTGEEWRLILSDETTEPFDPKAIEVGSESVFYCRVKGGAERARLLRPAWQALLPVIEEHDGSITLSYRGTRHGLAH